MATSATEEEFLQVLDEMNRICGAEEGSSSVAEVSGLGFEVGEMEEEDDDDEEEDKGPSRYDIHTILRNLDHFFLCQLSLGCLLRNLEVFVDP